MGKNGMLTSNEIDRIYDRYIVPVHVHVCGMHVHVHVHVFLYM